MDTVVRPERPSRRHLKVAWFRTVNPTVIDALGALPENPMCPESLYCSILERHCDHGGRIAAVFHDHRPLMVTGLRSRGRHRWENLTNWMVPGFVCAGAAQDVLPMLVRVHQDIAVAWWRMPAVTLPSAASCVQATPTHRLDVDQGPLTWTRNQRRNVQVARTKCAELEVHTNHPGDLEWVMHSWAEKWRDPTSTNDTTALATRIEIARHLQSLDRHVTIVLRDGETPVAGILGFIHDHDLVATVSFRDADSCPLPTGTRLMDLCLDYAKRRGLATYDLGGGQTYKARWAPESGEHQHLILSPAHLRLGRLVLRSGRQLATSARRLAPDAWRQPRGQNPFMTR